MGIKRPKVNRPSLSVLKGILSQWEIKNHPIFLRKVENFVYAINEMPLILRVTEKSHRSLEEIESELNWIQCLKVEGVNLAQPVPSLEGKFVVRSIDSGRTLFSVLFEKAKGHPLLEDTQFTADLYFKVGQVIGKMHKATRGFGKENCRKQWGQEDGLLMSLKVADPQEGHAYFAFIEALEWLKSLPVERSHYGLIHGDVHQGNFFVSDQGEITLFDFDDCHYNWFSYDIAVPIFSLFLRSCDKGKVFEFSNWYDSIKEGYLKEHAIDSIWMDRVPLFFRYRMALMYFWCKARIGKKDLEPDGLAWCKKCMEWCGEELKMSVQFF